MAVDSSGEDWEKDKQYKILAMYWGPFTKAPGLVFIKDILSL